MEDTDFVEDSELDTYINQSAAELYDLLVTKFEDYYMADPFLFTISSGNTRSLPSDFYKLRGLDRSLGGGQWIDVRRFNFVDRNRRSDAVYRAFGVVKYRIVGSSLHLTPGDQVTGDYRMWYIPKPTAGVVGVLSSLVLQDITYTSKDLYSLGDTISVEYTVGGTAGSEVVSVVGDAISVQIESGVSTATQIKAAIDASVASSDLVTAAISGTGSNAQTAASAGNLSGGVVQVDLNDFMDYDEFIVIDAAIKCLAKEESDISALQLGKDNITKRILAISANLDSSRPDQIADVYGFNNDEGINPIW